MEKIEEIIKRINNNTKTELPKDVEWKEFLISELERLNESKDIHEAELMRK